MEIIPAIDIIEGKCVRLIQGDYEQKKTYSEDPLDVAMKFEDAGLKRLHLVDLDGARTGEVKNWKVLEQIAGKTKLIIDFSGGISSQKNVEITFNSGAAFAAVGSIAIKDEAQMSDWLKLFEAKKFIIAADVKNEKVVVRGWKEETSFSVFDVIQKYLAKGIKQFFCTDISKDGLLQGSSVDLYKKIIEKFPNIYLIASGGVSDINEIDELQKMGCSGVIIGKAIYEKRILLSDLKIFSD